MNTAAIEDLHGGFEADTLAGAEQCVPADPAVVENHVAGVSALLTHLAIRVAEREPARARFDEESGDSVSAGLPGIGSCEDGEQTGLRRVGDVALGAVEHITIAIALSRRAE